MSPCRIAGCLSSDVAASADPLDALLSPFGAARHISKPWGHELLIALTERYAGKLIAIAAGARLSLQHHDRKDETLYIVTGTLRLTLEDAHGVMREYDLAPGERAHIAAGRRHRCSAPDEDVLLFETSTPELEDVVRHADDFGREGTSAFQSGLEQWATASDDRCRERHDSRQRRGGRLDES